MIKQVYKVQGMHCSSCAVNLEWMLEDINVKAKCHYAQAEIEVEYDPQKITVADIAAAVSRAGYHLSGA